MKRIINVHGHLKRTHNIDELVQEWKREGVIKFCVLALGKQWEDEGYYTNEDVLNIMKKYPDIIVGIGHIELGYILDPVEKISWLKDKGFSGLKFISPSVPYYDDRYFPYYEEAVKLNLPIIFHVGIIAVNKSDRKFGVNSEFMRPYTLDRVARCFPDLKIILAHPGEPHYQEAFTLCSTFKNIYVCLAGGGGSIFHISKLKKTLSSFPESSYDNPEENIAKIYFKKFVFGTDNPPVSLWYKRSEEIIEYFKIDKETREDYYWKNAAKIFEWNDLVEG